MSKSNHTALGTRLSNAAGIRRAPRCASIQCWGEGRSLRRRPLPSHSPFPLKPETKSKKVVVCSNERIQGEGQAKGRCLSAPVPLYAILLYR